MQGGNRATHFLGFHSLLFSIQEEHTEGSYPPSLPPSVEEDEYSGKLGDPKKVSQSTCGFTS